MAQRKVIWSHRAKIKLFQILEFYSDRNKSTTYSQKIYKKFNKELSLLVKYPNIGILTEIESVRGLIIEDFILFYEINSKQVIVHTVWDCRQNPEELIIK